jgi:hypothetical protein
MRLAIFWVICVAFIAEPSRVLSGDEDSPKVATTGASRALILVGLPGDTAHEGIFRATSGRWREWLVDSLHFDASEVRTIAGNRDEIAREVEALRTRSTVDDRLWVFVVGHANFEDGHAWLHLPGPDLTDDQFAALFRDLPGREQVFWVTTPASGAFVKPLAKPGRVVIAATESEGESNETEFPVALAEVSRLPLEKLDRDKNGQVNLLEVFETTVEAVEARFLTDQRVPTEHARIDDNGDGVGTEFKPPEPPARPDGALASKIVLFTIPRTTRPPARSPHGN